MSLAVSLRIADGLVIAADSLLTVRGKMQIATDLRVKCPECEKEIELEKLQIPPISFASSTRSFAQKLFQFKEKFGIASYGMGILNNKTIYYHVKEIERSHKDTEFESADAVAKHLSIYFHEELQKQIKDIDQAPDHFFPLGFQIVGYDKELKGKTIELRIGKKHRMITREDIGCTVSGDIAVVVQLWKLKDEHPVQEVNYHSFSLQDAIDYAEFLINSTSTYQRFANMLPTIGGDVDIALITPFHKFRWIKNKRLTKILEKTKEERS